MLRMLIDKLEKGESASFTAASGRVTEVQMEANEHGLYIRIEDYDIEMCHTVIENDYDDWETS